MGTGSTPLNGDYSAEALAALADALHNVGKEHRQLEALGAEARAEQVQTLLLAARGAFAQLYRDYGGSAEAVPLQTEADLAAGYWAHISARKEGAPTGLGALDDALGGGFQPGKLLVLLGAPGSGKTTLANQIVEHAAEHAGRPVLYVTSEDTPDTLLAKTLARLGNVDYGAVLQGYKSQQSAIDKALALVWERRSADRLAYLHDTGGLSLEQITERARAHFARYTEAEQGGPGILVIDYLQRLARSVRRAGGRAEELRAAVTELTEQLRAVALELNCTILALASQNRASGYNGSNALASAKESGDIEYTADVILALSEGKPAATGHKIYNLLLAKNRLGPSGETLELDWWGARQQFAGVKP